MHDISSDIADFKSSIKKSQQKPEIFTRPVDDMHAWRDIIINDQRVGFKGIAVMHALKGRMWGQKDNCCQTSADIQEKTRLKKNAVSSGLKELKELGYIRIKYTGRNPIYTACLPVPHNAHAISEKARMDIAKTPHQIKTILNNPFSKMPDQWSGIPKIPVRIPDGKYPASRITGGSFPYYGNKVVKEVVKPSLLTKSKIVPTVEEIDAYQKTIKEGINFNPQVFYQNQKNKEWPGDWKSQVPIWRIREAEYQAKQNKTRKTKKRVDRKKEISAKIDGYNDIPDTSWADDDQDNVVAIQEQES